MAHTPQWTRCRSVASLIVLFLASVLNQADRWVFPALAPAGLRCHVPSPDACNTTTANTTSNYGSELLESGDRDLISSNSGSANDSSPCASEGCIDFTSYDQGLLTGPAFAAVYVLSGLPLSRLADTSSRLLVLSIGVTFWSGMVLATGFVQTKWQLYVTRMGLGIGEATCNPVAYSLLADSFDPKHRALAIAIYSSGIYVGASLGNLSGTLDKILCWRWTFRLLGIAGAALLPFLICTLYGTERKKSVPAVSVNQTHAEESASVTVAPTAQGDEGRQLSLKETALELLRCPPYILLVIASATRLVGGYALGAWSATFYHEHFGEPPASYGTKLCIVFMVGGLPGSILGGYLADRLSKYGIQWKAYVIAITQIIAVPLAAAIFLMKSALPSYILLTVSFLFSESWTGVAAALVQDLHKPALRCQASAVFIAVGTLVGCVGPVLVSAILSHQGKCQKNYKWALLYVVPSAYLLSSLLFLVTAIVTHCRKPSTAAPAESQHHAEQPTAHTPSLQASGEDSDESPSSPRRTAGKASWRKHRKGADGQWLLGSSQSED